MAITDRDPISVSTEELEQLVRLEAKPPDDPQPVLSGPGRVLIASLSAAAGVIHLAMVPSHAGQWLPEGIAFAVAGWLQIGLAVLLLSKPSRTALRVLCLANVAFIAAWVVSRIFGSPFGPEAGSPHAASFVDVTCVAFEVAIVVLGYELLAKPTIGANLSKRSLALLSIIPIGALLLATGAIASPSAANHAHGGSGDLAAAGGGAGHGHANGAAMNDDHNAAANAAGHDHGGPATTAPVDDKGLSKVMNGSGEGGGHVHDTSVKPLDAETQAKLDSQLSRTKALADKYPKVKDAEAAGYKRQGPFAPALGAHYGGPNQAKGINLGPTVEGPALDNPMLIYNGVDPDSELVGFMYNIFSLDTQNPPEGFAGPNDHWHYHTDVCLTIGPDGTTDAPLGADSSATKELCDKYGGHLIKNTGYMVHVWTVPGWESPQGLFSNLNAKITCPNGTYHMVEQEEIGHRKNVCKDVPA